MISHFDFRKITLENVYNLSIRNKIILLSVIFCGILLIFCGVDTLKQMRKLHMLDQQHQELQKSLQSKKNDLENLTTYQSQISEMKKKFNMIFNFLLKPKKIPELLEDISKTGQGLGLKFNSVDPGKEIIHDFYAEIPIKMTVTGNYNQFRQFIADIAAMPHMITFHDFIIQHVSEKNVKEDHLLTMELMIKTYHSLISYIVPSEEKPSQSTKMTEEIFHLKRLMRNPFELTSKEEMSEKMQLKNLLETLKMLKAKKKVSELSSLTSELLQINYANASDLAKLLKVKGNSLLSIRGHVSVDQRTNILWILDIPEKLAEIRHFIRQLDVPVKQVLIEARVVTVDKNIERDLGIRFGVTAPHAYLNEAVPASKSISSHFMDRLNVDLPIMLDTSKNANVGLAVAKLNRNVLLDLELSALEAESRGEVIASPRLITANQQAARIESGEEIPYQETTVSGATSVSFKKAALSLEVTPQITPDQKIILTMKINQDRASTATFNGVPAIITREIETKVLVDNGQTVVLGGIYQQTKNRDIKRLPFLGTLPIVGLLFKNKTVIEQREELLIFVTPKIIQSDDAP